MLPRTLALAFVVFSVAACGTLVPDTSPDEQAGYNAAARVISAIEQFRQDHGHYPAALHDLVPGYFRHASRLAFSAPDGESRNFEYKHNGDTYTLAFGFSFRGMIEWRTYFSAEKKWHPISIDP
jgi:hypothetical protein